jgi:hypothetical protein
MMTNVAPSSRFILVILISSVLSLWHLSCIFDVNLPLENDPPVCTNVSAIKTSLIYPDSTVCTLMISDRNDAQVSLSMLRCSTATSDTMVCDSLSVVPWPGTCSLLAAGYGTKQLRLVLDTNRMGIYKGILLIQDAARATLRIPFTIEYIFFDAFDTYPLSASVWRPYRVDDSTHLGFEYTDRKLTFTFKQSADTSALPVTAGIRSVFSLPASFHAAIDFKLRDEMDEAFEIGFFISNSPDTGRWAGEQAGMFITGVNGQLRFECRSINLQSYSYESNVTAGELGIGRVDSTINYYLHDGNPAVEPTPLTFQSYPADVPVYVHLKMTVLDCSRDRYCAWNDFTVFEGCIDLPSY